MKKIDNIVKYIEQNLDREPSLDEISSEVGLSKFHLNHIFRAFTGETLYSAIYKMKIERAAVLLHTMPSSSITEIASKTGFNETSDFSKAFKKRFSVSPTAWRKNKEKLSSATKGLGYLIKDKSKKNKDIELTALSAEVRRQKDFSIAYIRHTGAYAGDSALFIYLYNKLTAWAASKDLLSPEHENVVIYHSPVEISANEKLKISLGISIPDNTSVSGDIGKMIIKGGDYLICRYKLRDNEYGDAWTQVYRKWLPELELLPSDGVCFERYPNDMENTDKYSTIVDICIPVKRPDSDK